MQHMGPLTAENEHFKMCQHAHVFGGARGFRIFSLVPDPLPRLYARTSNPPPFVIPHLIWAFRRLGDINIEP